MNLLQLPQALPAIPPNDAKANQKREYSLKGSSNNLLKDLILQMKFSQPIQVKLTHCVGPSTGAFRGSSCTFKPQGNSWDSKITHINIHKFRAKLQDNYGLNILFFLFFITNIRASFDNNFVFSFLFLKLMLVLNYDFHFSYRNT